MLATAIHLVRIAIMDVRVWAAELVSAARSAPPEDLAEDAALPALIAQARLMLAMLEAGQSVPPGVFTAWFDAFEAWRSDQ